MLRQLLYMPNIPEIFHVVFLKRRIYSYNVFCCKVTVLSVYGALVMYRLISIENRYNLCFWGIGSVKNACNYQFDTDSFKADLTMKMVVTSNKHSKIIKKVSNTRLSAKFIS